MRLPTALAIEHTPTDPPARLGDWLARSGLLLDVVAPAGGAAVPETLAGYAALVVLGGPMSATDETPDWLPATRALLRAAVRDRVPALGICLGAQLLAAALGGRVERGAAGPEIGPGLVAKRDAAAADPLFGPVPFTPDVVHWHWDAITVLPAGALPLAASSRYPHQAFRVGDVAWGLQFHIETTPPMLRDWAAGDAAALAEQGIDVGALLDRHDLEELHSDLEQVWQPFAARFAEVVRAADHRARSAAAP